MDPNILLAGSRLQKPLACKYLLSFMEKKKVKPRVQKAKLRTMNIPRLQA